MRSLLLVVALICSNAYADSFPLCNLVTTSSTTQPFGNYCLINPTIANDTNQIVSITENNGEFHFLYPGETLTLARSYRIDFERPELKYRLVMSEGVLRIRNYRSRSRRAVPAVVVGGGAAVGAGTYVYNQLANDQPITTEGVFASAAVGAGAGIAAIANPGLGGILASGAISATGGVAISNGPISRPNRTSRGGGCGRCHGN